MESDLTVVNNKEKQNAESVVCAFANLLVLLIEENNKTINNDTDSIKD